MNAHAISLLKTYAQMIGAGTILGGIGGLIIGVYETSDNDPKITQIKNVCLTIFNFAILGAYVSTYIPLVVPCYITYYKINGSK